MRCLILWPITLALLPWCAFGQSRAWDNAITEAASAYGAQQYGVAEIRFIEAKKAAESFGPTDARLGTTLNYLAELYVREARYAEAEPLFKQALEIWNQAAPSAANSVSKANVLNNLAALYQYQSRYRESEPLYLECLALREKILGPEHPDVGSTLDNLGALDWAQGRFDAAEPLFRRALLIKEKTLKANDPALAPALTNLAALDIRKRNTAEAEALLKRALSIRQAALGPNHPEVARLAQ